MTLVICPQCKKSFETSSRRGIECVECGYLFNAEGELAAESPEAAAGDAPAPTSQPVQEEQPAKEVAAAVPAAPDPSQEDDSTALPNLQKLAKGVLVTTTDQVEGYRVVKYRGIESVELVVGAALFSEMTSTIREFLRGQTDGLDTKLNRAKGQAFDALRIQAARKHANAVIGAHLSYVEFSDHRVGLILSGTLVQLAPVSG